MTDRPVVTGAAIALGSNVGDRQAWIDQAVHQLSFLLDDLRVARVRETAPVGVQTPQSAYLNTVAIGGTPLAPRALLEALHAIERALGRTRPHRNAPRTIDLDLILHGDAVVQEPGLQVPHPRFRDRLFVLEPLAELAPDWRDPVTGLTVRALRARAAAG